MNRRLFLQGLGSLGLASILSSCGSATNQRIVVQVLRRSLPIQLLRKAKRGLDPAPPLHIAVSADMAELYGMLQRCQESKQPTGLNLFSLGDYWLTQAIQSDLIEPLTLPETSLSRISPRWRSLVQRNQDGTPNQSGPIWGAPYRWGATVLVYRKDKLRNLGLALTDWDDLWRPELSQRIGLLNQPREVIGMVLKALGYSYNTPHPKAQSLVQEKLRSLHQQTRIYSSKNYIQPLILGDVWVAMGWSSDIIPALSQADNLDIVFPMSGSAVWADIWVKAKASTPKSQNFPVDQLVDQWINYWWSDRTAEDLDAFTAAAPVITPPTLSAPDRQRDTILTQDSLESSEFLLPLSTDSIEHYRSLWLETRQS